jgi:hypothetical protein
MEELSLLHRAGAEDSCRQLPEETVHDLALEEICTSLTKSETERKMICRIMSKMPTDAQTVQYRSDVFEDILRFPALRERMMKLLDRVDFLRTYGSFGKDSDASGIWELVHRLDEIDEYIQCVQAIYECLTENEIRSEGLLALREYVKRLYEDHGFEALKKDIAGLKRDTSKIQSVTLGVNLNDRFEPEGVGIVSINTKAFTKSGILSNFCDFLNRGDEIQEGNEWKGNYNYHVAKNETMSNLGNGMEKFVTLTASRGFSAVQGVSQVVADGRSEDVMRTLDRAVSGMLTSTVKKLKQILSKHITVSTQVITGLIPEFMYYIRWAEYVEGLQKLGFSMCKPELSSGSRGMQARGIYNIRLAVSAWEHYLEETGLEAKDVRKGEPVDKASFIVKNDLDFDAEHRLYILTGANRGGKTTITQAVGAAFLMAQGGIYVPADSFTFDTADGIYTHFPADENKTMDLGRLGEESKRFRDLFMAAGPRSLILLNESFSTTSFEEGFYIARDAVRAMQKLGCRLIYNTHMHKLAEEIDVLNREAGGENGIASLVAETEDGTRSYRVRVAPPQGLSYARDIAEKYGVTYEQLAQGKFAE